jgi:AcrR family transcriptional regulator
MGPQQRQPFEHAATIAGSRALICVLDTAGLIVQKRLQMPGESSDPRSMRAREQIAFALAALARDKAYDDITVQDIAQRAQVSRTTFYAHFQDRDGIPLRLSVLFGSYLGRQLRWGVATNQYRFPLEALLAHMLDIRPLYEALHRAGRTDHLLKVFRINLAKGFERWIGATRRKVADVAPVPAPLLAQHIAGTVVQFLAWWMENHCPLEPRTADEHFHRLLVGLR